MPVESEHEQALRQTADAEGGIDWSKLWSIVGPMLRLLLDLIDRHITTANAIGGRTTNPDEIKQAEAARTATAALAAALQQLGSRGNA